MIYQIVPEFYQYDAISQHARHIDRMFKEVGLEASLCAQRVLPPSLSLKVLPVAEAFKMVGESDTILFHFSIFSPLIESLPNLPGRKIMIYHNITPAAFFEGISRKTLEACKKGRYQLADAAPLFHLALGVSRFNEGELKQVGYTNTGVLPLVVEINTQDDQTIRSLYYLSEKTTLLHVGKWAPNKKIQDIVKVFYFYHKINPASRLVLVGRNWEWENYTASILDLIQNLHLQENIKIYQELSSRDLAALYRASDLYLSMSEHEGFCAPLIEAMARDCPVIAYRAGAVPETVQDAGLLWDTKDFPAIAEGMHRLFCHEEVRKQLQALGERRAGEFTYETVFGRFRALLPLILSDGRN